MFSRPPFALVDLAVEGGVAALFIFFGSTVGMRGLGCAVVSQELVGWRAERIPYGWKGQEPSGYITGVWAKALVALGGLAGLWMVLEPGLWLAIFGWSEP